MDLTEVNTGVVIPVESLNPSRLKISQNAHDLENRNPNLSSDLSPVISKSVKKSASRNPNLMVSGKNKIRERRFVVAKKRLNKVNSSSAIVSCMCKEKYGDSKMEKCLCTAYERLRASQEDFFKNGDYDEEDDKDGTRADFGVDGEEGGQGEEFGGDHLPMYESNSENSEETKSQTVIGNSVIKRRREMVMEEARKSVPELGSGVVMHLVKAFEKLLSIPPSLKKSEENEKKKTEVMQWALPGMMQPKVSESESESLEPLPSFCPSDLFLTSENLGLDSRISSPWDGSPGSFSISSRTSGGGRKCRRNSIESSCIIGGKRWKKKQLRITSQKPFNLRTEERGRLKEEELMKKIEKMMEEQERLRIPVAQGLPWTTDEPECLIKPPVKDSTKPIDLILHSDLRAAERAEFDQQVAEKLSLIEQYKVEKERLEKLAEEEETRRMRRELIPKAQPMPYFDRPFIPRRSMKHPTIPKEPKFHIPQHKRVKGSLSWNDIGPYTHSYEQ